MKTKPHPYFEKATYLLIISALLGIIELFFDNSFKELNILVQIFSIVATFVLMIYIIYSVWIEKNWTKYILPIFLFFGIIDTIDKIISIKLNSANLIYSGIDILSTIFFIAATVYVLKVPKKVI